MKKIVVTMLLACVSLSMMAQPAKSRTATTTRPGTSVQANKNAAGKTTSSTTTTPTVDRASLMFPVKDAMPEDVAWRRDIYRQLDLKVSKNAALYYPVEPNGQQMNLFTCIFRLVLAGRIDAFTYKLDGNESFDPKDKLNLIDFLNDQSINYEEKNGKPTVADADVPSREVKRYYLKESTYLDQRTGTTHTKVVALCPIKLEGADEFAISSDFDDADEPADVASANYTSKPLFWVKYDDIAPYLAKLPVMASDLNNVTNMTAADYFNRNQYQGKIYKTNNMQGQTLKDYCKTDSAMTKEQERIEKELKDFENHLWGHVEVNDSADSTAVAGVEKGKKSKTTKATDSTEKKETATNRRAAKQKENAGSSSSAPRVSARRERR